MLMNCEGKYYNVLIMNFHFNLEYTSILPMGINVIMLIYFFGLEYRE